MLLGECYGRLQIEMKDNGLELQAFDFVLLPFKEAIRFFKSKKIMSKDAFDKLSDAYKRKSFTVAGDHKDYVLDQTKGLIDKAIEEGATRQEFIDTLNQKFDDWGVTRLKTHHLETVFDTNVLGSYSHGRWRQQKAPHIQKRRPYFEYKTVGDDDVRPAHAAMDGVIRLQSDAIWDSWYPPNGFRCRCIINTVSRAEIEEEGLEINKKLPKVEGKRVRPDEGFNASPDSWLK